MASSSSPGSPKSVADLLPRGSSSCSLAPHHALQLVIDDGLTASHIERKGSSCQLADGSSSGEIMETEITLPEVLCNCKYTSWITDDGLTASHIERKGSSCQLADGSSSDEIMETEITLPEDILWKIHALMPMEDAARAACLSHCFLQSWRCYPKLIFEMRALCLGKQSEDFINRVDHIMRNHSGIGVKTFKLRTRADFNIHRKYLDCWLPVAITPGIKEFVLGLPMYSMTKYNFMGSLLSGERANSIQSFHLSACAFHSVDKVGYLSSLKTVYLCAVGITGEELCVLLSNSFALERLELESCSGIHCLKIPHPLLKLKFLGVQSCKMLQMIECSAQNVSVFNYIGPLIHISFGDSLKVKKMQMTGTTPNLLHYASTKLQSIAPNVRTLFLYSLYETVNTTMVLGKFLHLKYLEIQILIPSRSPDYDFCSLVSFLDACPALKTFVLRVEEEPTTAHDWIPGANTGDDSLARYVTKHCHDKLKSVTITGFCPLKTMIELTRCIIEYATSLKYLTLDTTRGHHRRKFGNCFPLRREVVMMARKGLEAIKTYIEGKVPSKINFKVLEPCNCNKCQQF